MAEKLLTPSEVAERLQVHEKTVHTWLKTGKMKGIKLDRFWRIEEADLNEFLEQRKTVH